MKRIPIIVIMLLMACLSASAQYADGGNGLRYKGGWLYTMDGAKVDMTTAADYMSQEDYQQYYLKGSRLFKAGIVVSSVGGGIIVGSLMFDLIYPNVRKNSNFTTGVHVQEMGVHVPVVTWLGSIVGGTLLAVSVPLYCVGAHKLKKVANLSFVTPSGGVGLAFRF